MTTKMSGTRAKSGENSEKILTELSGKMTILINKVDGLIGSFHEVESFLRTQGRNFQEIFDLNTKDDSAIGTQNTLPILKEMNDLQAEIEANRFIEKMNDIWKRSLNERKQSFANMIRCKNIAMIYQNWRTIDRPILPEKFLIREIEGEHPDETEIRARLALHRLDTEISLLQSRMQRYKEKFMSIDAAMYTEISERTSGHIQTKLNALWQQSTKREEEKTFSLWQNQQEWFDNYEKEYGDQSILKLKPKHQGRTNENINEATADSTDKSDCDIFRNALTKRTYAQILSSNKAKNKVVNFSVQKKTTKTTNSAEYNKQRTQSHDREKQSNNKQKMSDTREKSPDHLTYNTEWIQVSNRRGRGSYRGGRARGRGQPGGSLINRGRGRAPNSFLGRGWNAKPPDPRKY